MDKKNIVYLHIFIWLFAVFANLPYPSIGKGMPLQQIVSYVFGFLYLMVVFYLFYSWLVPLFLDRRKLISFLAISCLVIILLPFFGYVILYLFRAYFDGTFTGFFRGYSFQTHMSGFYPVLTAAVFGSFFRSIISWFATMNQKKETDRQKLTAELNLLKSKLNPHFLFNTLNNIDTLIQQDPDKASEALIRLSEMMRYLTYETESEVVELSREIGYIRNFIELYRMRIRSPDDIRFEYSGDPGVMISPALFVPLVENAFKFASFSLRKPGVEITLDTRDGIITFNILNSYEKDAAVSQPDHSGYGLVNLKKRLDLVYPGRHQLIIDPDGRQFHVKLIIETHAAQVHSH